MKAIINDRPAVLLSNINDETSKDETLLKIRAFVTKGNWENYRRDPDIVTFYTIKNESGKQKTSYSNKTR